MFIYIYIYIYIYINIYIYIYINIKAADSPLTFSKALLNIIGGKGAISNINY